MRTALFCVTTQRAVVIPYRRFGTAVSWKIYKYTAGTELSSFNVCVGKWVCECMGFVICGCVCVYVGFVMCGCFDNCVCVIVICVLVFTVFFIVSSMYNYSHLPTSVKTTVTK